MADGPTKSAILSKERAVSRRPSFSTTTSSKPAAFKRSALRASRVEPYNRALGYFSFQEFGKGHAHTTGSTADEDSISVFWIFKFFKVPKAVWYARTAARSANLSRSVPCKSAHWEGGRIRHKSVKGPPHFTHTRLSSLQEAVPAPCCPRRCRHIQCFKIRGNCTDSE